MLAEAIGGYFTNSLALVSDAGHMLTDVAALGLSLLAIRFASKPATPRKTYGFYRLEILAALANGITLLGLSVLICREAWERFQRPEKVDAIPLILISIGGLIVNIISAWLLSRSAHENLNIRGALLHIFGDLLGSAAAIISGLAILWRGWYWADPLISVLISLLIIYSAWRLVTDSVNVLLEGTPSHINPSSVEASMRTVAGVRAVHDLHIWTITSERYALTAHVVVDDLSEGHRILRELRALLSAQFHLTHSTIQLEDPYLSAMVAISKSARDTQK
jgi:cobalt-zinc-cadmium efflux system protein